MDDTPSTLTSVSLLAQIREDDRDPEVWSTFVDL